MTQTGASTAPPAIDPQLRGLLSAAVESHQAGRVEEAERAYEALIAALGDGAASPALAANAHFNLGVLLKSLGRVEEAIVQYGRAAQLDPSDPDAQNNLGIAMQAQGRLEEAASCFERVLALEPGNTTAHYNLGNVLKAQGKIEAAASSYSRVLELAPDDSETHRNLAILRQAQGKLEEAAGHYRHAIRLDPGDAHMHNNLGAAVEALGEFDEAAACYRKAVELKPDFPEAHSNLGARMQDRGRLTEAVALYRSAIALKPDYVDAYSNLGNALGDLGRLDEAIACYRKAIEIRPDYLDAYSNLLMSFYYSARYSDAEIMDVARKFAAQVERPAPHAFRNSRDPARRLRIGYVSADFRMHAVGRFFDRVLPAHDPAEFETICYSNSNAVDAMTERLRAASGLWRDIVGLSDAEAHDLIRRDGVDILVDLSGHTAGNRLALFATRPAPVQATWLGYFGTTGLSAIDAIVADRFVAPPGDEARFTETVRRLSRCYLCYSPHSLTMPTAPFPAFVNGCVTFGCFNTRAKIGGETVAAWAAILARVAGSRLFLKAKSFADAECKAALLAQFAGHGIAGDRLIFEGWSPLADVLAAYNRVDIALDPFPFGGCTTTADTLWMGVPLVTQRGARWVGRMSETILATLGLSDWVAGNTAQYIETACRLASALPQMAGLRADLRRRLEDSSFCDGPRFTRSLEAAYRDMWIAWCAG